ncbi:MAG: saccharopine dehydrogenase C-terminal domain-containing protein [Saprospiraceae bacterium]
MKRILVVGAGLSTSCLIEYLLKQSVEFDWKVVVGDLDIEIAKKKINGHVNGKAIEFDVFNDAQRAREVKKADIVISMLPARFHYLIVKSCLKFRKNLVTASYISPELRELNDEAKEKGILILNEIGLDPGIDHLSAMRVINNIKNSGGKILQFRSSTGGLVAPKSDNNPWNYKLTWNPRNVVLAGQGGAQYIDRNSYKYTLTTNYFKD